jgi:trehalose synthase
MSGPARTPALLAPLQEVAVEPLPLDRFDLLLAPAEQRALRRALDRAGDLLAGRTVWCVSSTAVGGGVAQLLRTTLGYVLGSGLSARWVVIGGTPAFFDVTKRVHHLLHGAPLGSDPLTDADRVTYESVLARNATALARVVRPGDVVVLHDPQTAGLATAARGAGARVVWRSHIGADRPNDRVAAAWRLLAPYLRDVDRFVFTVPAFAWPEAPSGGVSFVTPAIDPTATKNAHLTCDEIEAVLVAVGLVAGDRVAASYPRGDGTRGVVAPHDVMTHERPLRPDERYVLHISRWDPLKDPAGVMRAFARHVVPEEDVHLVLAGPEPANVADDPEAAAVLDGVLGAWRALAPAARERVHLARLSLDDLETNAAIVNALQRRASVVVKKSFAEGFGLGVTEAMWKARPIVATAVGGVRLQLRDADSAVLVGDPADEQAFGRAIVGLLRDRRFAYALGAAAHARARARFLEHDHLMAWCDVVRDVLRPAQRWTRSRNGAPVPRNPGRSTTVMPASSPGPATRSSSRT